MAELVTTLEVAATYPAIRDLAQRLRDLCQAAGVDDPALMDLELATVEAANNIVEHGFAGGSIEGGTIAMQINVEPAQVAVTLVDRGPPVPSELFSRCRPVPGDAESGRGVGILQSCVDRIGYCREGDSNILLLEKDRAVG